jgi:hypothetical protein
LRIVLGRLWSAVILNIVHILWHCLFLESDF